MLANALMLDQQKMDEPVADDYTKASFLSFLTYVYGTRKMDRSNLRRDCWF